MCISIFIISLLFFLILNFIVRMIFFDDMKKRGSKNCSKPHRMRGTRSSVVKGN